MTDGQHRFVYAAGLAGMGVVLVSIQVANYLRLVHLGPSSLLHTATLVLLALTLVYAGVWLGRNNQFDAWTDRVAAWSIGGAFTFGAVAILSALALPSLQAPDTVTLLLDTVTAGSVAGLLVGLYDAQSRHRHVELQRERDRIQHFAQQAESLNKYGKALNQSRTLDEVSGLCMEVLELLIGSRDAAFVIVDDGTTIFDSTLREESELASLRAFAREVANGGPMETIIYPDDVQTSLPTDSAVGVPIPMDMESTAVLVALTDADAAYTAQDLDLLELLSAHVATALPDANRTLEELDPRGDR